MSVKAVDLDTPERGMSLVTREAGEEKAKKRDEMAISMAAELRELYERIAAAKLVQPEAKHLHCRDCFDRGRNAALKVVEGE